MGDRMDIDDDNRENSLQGSGKRKTRADEDYEKGALKQIVVQDFMTYASAQMDAAPKLNVIVGPNGTGKSSLVCALCLALGGKNELLARQARTKSFVRRGATTGFAQVTVAGENGSDYIIRRCINADDDTSTWSINGSSVTMEAVKTLKKELNIQLDNLLQFMPQDRVAEFSGLDPKRLLLETERAVGDADLSDKHNKLISLSQNIQSSRKARDSVAQRLEHVRSELKDMEMDVQRVIQRDELLEEVKVIKGKLVWTLAWELKNKHREAEKKLKQGILQQKETQRELNKNSEPLRYLQEEGRQLRQTATQLQSRLQELSSELETHEASLQGFEDDMILRDRDINTVNMECQRYTTDIKQLESKTSELQKKIAEHPGIPQEMADRRKELKQEHNDISCKIRSEAGRADSLEADRKKKVHAKQQLEEYLEKIGAAATQRVLLLEKLRRKKFKGMHSAYEWVKANKHCFKDEVYGPLVAEVEVNNPLHAQALEQVVGIGTWSCFVTKNMDDKEVLQNEVRRLGLMQDVNVMVMMQDSNESTTQSPEKTAALEKYGVQGTLDTLIQAPQLVKEALCTHHDISDIYVGNTQTEEVIEELLEGHPEVEKLITPTSAYFVASSYYSSAKTIQSSSLRPNKFFRAEAASQTSLVEDRRARLDQLIQEIQELDQESIQQDAYVADYKKQKEKIREELAVIDEEEKQVNKGKGQIQKELISTKKSLAMKRNSRNPMCRKEELIKEKEEAKKEGIQKVNAITNILKEMCEYHQKYAATRLSLNETEQLTSANDELVTQLQRDLREDQEIVQKLREIAESDERQAEQAAATARSQCPMTPSLRGKFGDYPDAADELEQMMHEIECEAAGITCNNSEAVNDYQSLLKDIAGLETTLGTEQQKLSDLEDQAAAVKRAWLPKLKATVKRINETFTKNFSLIGSVGEVELVGEETHGEEYEKYSIEIRVTFRDGEPLRALDSSTQSGGERSVSTMLYLISLQAVTHTPFRVVDEINQGMDDINERKIFDILAASARGAETPQCFLLTPKILPDLEYPEEEGTVSIHMIFNGTDLPIPSELRNYSLGKRRKTTEV